MELYGKHRFAIRKILKDKIGSVIGDADGLVAALNKLHDFGDIFFSEQFPGASAVVARPATAARRCAAGG